MTDPACCWWGCSLPQIATSDLYIPAVGQLEATHLPLSDEFEPDSMKVVGATRGAACSLAVVHPAAGARAAVATQRYASPRARGRISSKPRQPMTLGGVKEVSINGPTLGC